MVNCTAPGDGFEKTPQAARLMKKYKVDGWPNVLFLDAGGRVVDRFAGCRNPEFVVDKLKGIRKPFERWPRVGKLVEKLRDKDRRTRRDAAADLRRLRAALDAALADYDRRNKAE